MSNGVVKAMILRSQNAGLHKDKKKEKAKKMCRQKKDFDD